jgi:4'-phosphopantetheinyl transferase
MNNHPVDVEIWRIPLCADRSILEFAETLISKEERERLKRFHFGRDRRRFLVARAAMRQILGAYLKVAPKSLAFEYGIHGKPELAHPHQEVGCCFNLSHSYELALLAVAQRIRVGVDIEFVDPAYDSEQIAELSFSPTEIRRLHAMPPEQRADAFFSCWTRKEAYAKALAKGLSIRLDTLDVGFGPDTPDCLPDLSDLDQRVSHWKIYDIPCATGYKAALVAEAGPHRICTREWKLNFDCIGRLDALVESRAAIGNSKDGSCSVAS